jgi:DNA-binding transcriptional ArsR family regulator
VQQEVVLAMLAKEPTYGYELRARLRAALGPVAEGLNAGQVYVTLTRLEKAGLVTATAEPGQLRPDRRVYELTAAGPDGIPPEAGRGGRRRAGGPGRDRGRAAARAAAPAAGRAARRPR